jgi:hypothetical protein
MNPHKVKARENAIALEREQKRLEFMDDDLHDKYMKNMFYQGERDDCEGVVPARERIKQYKTRHIRR